MKIYLAGPCDTENRTTMVNVAKWLRYHEVYCPWELKIKNAWNYNQEEWSFKVFEADIKAIHNADAIVLISTGRISSAGTNWEQGYGYALGKPIYVIQITDATTSLMTFCGCTLFINTNKENLNQTITWLDEHLTLTEDEREEVLKYFESTCKTVLT